MLMTKRVEDNFTVSQVAGMIQVSERTVYRWIKAETIDFVALPGRGKNKTEYRIPASALKAKGLAVVTPEVKA